MEYSKQLKILLSVMTIIILSGLTMAASLNAQRAGYHVPLYTSTLVDYDGANAPIVINGGLISQGDMITTTNTELVFGHKSGGLLSTVGTEISKISSRYRYGSTNIETPKISFINYNNAGTGWYSTTSRFSAGISLYTIHSNSQIEALTINSQGNVGIGSSNPIRDLDILQSTTNADSGLVVRSGTGSSNVAGHLWAGTGGFVIDSRDADLTGDSNIHLRTGGTDRIYIRGDGDVGIGTSTPSYKLDVAGTGRFTGTVTVATPTADGHAANKAYVDSLTSGGSNWLDGTGDVVYRLDGNVGIGIEHPVAKLHVKGISGGSCIGTANACSTYNTNQDACNNQEGCSYSSFNCNTITNENVCIATVGCTPSYGGGSGDPFEIPAANGNGGGDGSMVICEGGTHTSCTGTADQCYTFLNQADCGTTVGTGQRGCYWVGTSAIFDQKVGIGTTVPQELLHVMGDVRVDGNLKVKRGGLIPEYNCPSADSGYTRISDWNGFGCMYTRYKSYDDMSGRTLTANCPWGMTLVSGGCAWNSDNENVHKNHPEMINGRASWVCEAASKTGTTVSVICI